MKEPTIRLEIRLPQGLYNALDELAEHEDRTANRQVRYMLHELLAPRANHEGSSRAAGD